MYYSRVSTGRLVHLNNIDVIDAGQAQNVTLARECMTDIAVCHQQQVRERKKAKQEVDDEVLYFYESDEVRN